MVKIKKSRGTESDCSTVKAGVPVDDAILLSNNLRASIEGGNCISVKDKNDKVQFERCLNEGNIIRLRHIKGDFLPLTFINGPHSMDVDFVLDGSEWVAKSITFYKHTSDGDLKTTKAMHVSLSDFDFGTIAEKFD